LLPFPLQADLTADAAGQYRAGIDGFTATGSCSGPVFCDSFYAAIRQADLIELNPPYEPALFEAFFGASATYGLLATGYSYALITPPIGVLDPGGEVNPRSSVAWNDTVTFNGSGDGFLQLNFEYQIQGWYYADTGSEGIDGLPIHLQVTVGTDSLNSGNLLAPPISLGAPAGPFSVIFPIAFGVPLAFDASIQEDGAIFYSDSPLSTNGGESLFLESMQTFDEDMDPVPLSYASAAGATYGVPEPATGWMVLASIGAAALARCAQHHGVRTRWHRV
jgi:hypothetical protein